MVSKEGIKNVLAEHAKWIEESSHNRKRQVLNQLPERALIPEHAIQIEPFRPDSYRIITFPIVIVKTAETDLGIKSLDVGTEDIQGAFSRLSQGQGSLSDFYLLRETENR